MADLRLIPPGIDDERTRAINTLCDRLDAIDPAGLFLWDFERLPSSALPAMAWQLHVLGDEGWAAAETEEQKRALLAMADTLHARRGTPWAVREALLAVGLGPVEIVEGLGDVAHDGQVRYDGSVPHTSAGRWAMYRLRYEVGDAGPWTLPQLELLRRIAQVAAPARCTLAGVAYRERGGDDVEVADAGSTVTVWQWIRHDGTHAYGGQTTYSGAVTTAGVWA